jgi:hypothetical protein
MTSEFEEKRRHPRIDSLNLVAYALYDVAGKKIDQGKGRTLNLSQSGTLLETDKELRGPFVVLMTIDLGGNKVKVQGRVVHTTRDKNIGRFLTGIEFMGSKDRQYKAIVAFVKTYQHWKYQADMKK